MPHAGAGRGGGVAGIAEHACMRGCVHAGEGAREGEGGRAVHVDVCRERVQVYWSVV